MEPTPSIPDDDFIARAEILYSNGVGFQAPTKTRPLFIVARCVRGLDVATLAKLKTSCALTHTPEMFDFLGIDFLGVHWEDYARIDAIFNALLADGHGFATHTNRWGVPFGPDATHAHPREYSRANAELAFISSIEDLIATTATFSHTGVYNLKGWLLGYSQLHEFNYVTQDGKKFCREMRIKMGKATAECQKKKHDFYQWEVFKNVDLTTLQTVVNDDDAHRSKKRKLDDDNDDDDLELRGEDSLESNECVVCLNHKLVLRLDSNNDLFERHYS